MKQERKANYIVEKIGENIFRIDEFGSANCYLVVGSQGALLVDVGMGLSDLLGEVRKITDLPITVVCTHGHFDHIGGMGQFPEIYLHPDDCGIRFFKFINTMLVKRLWRSFSPTPARSVKKGKLVPNNKNTKILPLADGHVFDLGGKTVKVEHLPGHTKGSVVLLCEEDDIMFTGDNVNKMLFMFVPNLTSVEEWLTSAYRTLELCNRYKPYGGHDEGLQFVEKIELQIAYGNEILSFRKRNSVFPLIKGYPKISGTDYCFIYRADKVFAKKKK